MTSVLNVSRTYLCKVQSKFEFPEDVHENQCQHFLDVVYHVNQASCSEIKTKSQIVTASKITMF